VTPADLQYLFGIQGLSPIALSYSTEQYMERHFVDTAKAFVYYPYLKKGEVRARGLRSWDRGTSGRWHIHCAIELPLHSDGIALENLICDCCEKVEWVMVQFLSATVRTRVGSTTC
jgi:hypothetical protein